MKIALAAACVVLFAACGINEREEPEKPMKTTPFVQSVPPVAETETPKATGWVPGATTRGMSGVDQSFLTTAATRGLVEVKMGNLVLEKGTHAEPRNFAWRMITDYSSVNAQVTQLAARKGMTIPTELRGQEKVMFDQLSKLSGVDFDKAYMQHVAGTEYGLSAFERASTSAEDADVKAFATSTLSTLRHHVPMAKEAVETFQRDINRVIRIE